MDHCVINIIKKFFNSIYETGEISEESLHSIFISIFKKHTAKLCEDYRTISLTLGIKEALFCIQVLIESCGGVNCEVFVCFMEFKKAFAFKDNILKLNC